MWRRRKHKYVFSERSDAYMRACKQAGIFPLVAMTFGNKHYDHEDGPSTPLGFEGYGNYGQAILEKYGDEIHWLEIWNEYNGTWAPPSAKESLKDRYTTYTEMLKVAYQKIKEVRPDVQVLGGAAVLIPIPYFEGIFKLGGLDSMDAVVIHPYRTRPEGVDKEVAELQELMKRYNGGKAKPVWVTETGRHTKEEYDWEKGRRMYEKGRADGARYLPRMYTLLLKQDVAKIYWYLASDHASFVSMGLVRHHKDEKSGMPRLSVAPSYVSYANLIHQLDGGDFIERQGMREYTRAYVQLFRRGSEEIRVCWSTQPARMRFETSQPLTVVGLMGAERVERPANGAVEIDLSEDIVYVKGSVRSVTEIDSGHRFIAATKDDYSKTQGENNWYYGYYESGDDRLDPADFKELKQVETMWGYDWGGVTRYLKVTPGGMHPDKKGGKPVGAVKRWESPLTGTVRIEGVRSRGDKGDGITAKILVDGEEVFSKQVGGSGGDTRVDIDFTANVRKGSKVDFVCLPNKGTDFDATGLDALIIDES